MNRKTGITTITAAGFGVLLDNQIIKPRFRATVYPGPLTPVEFDGDTMEAAIEAAVVGMGLEANNEP